MTSSEKTAAPSGVPNNAEKKAADIKVAGEMPVEALAGTVSRELFKRNGAGWFAVSVAKGLTTVEELVKLFGFCAPFFVETGKEDAG